MRTKKVNTNDKTYTFSSRLKADMKKNYPLYLLLLPVMVYYIIFYYKPMYGAVIAFKEYQPSLGIADSPWVGLEQFRKFFANPDFLRILRNTLTVSISTIVFGFPAPIILALMFNELRGKKFKSIAQTVSYLPHFISLVVVCGLVKSFVSPNGFIYDLVVALGGEEQALLNRQELYVPIYVLTGIWQEVGWNSIIYIAALSAIDQGLYEAAKIDGAGKWRQTLAVTLPGIAPTIIIMLILKMGTLLSVGYEKTILLYNPLIYETSDIISSYVYRVGIGQQSWSYSSAVGLLNSIVNFIIIMTVNKISAKCSETSLW